MVDVGKGKVWLYRCRPIRMNVTMLQDSFNRGEISPKLYLRSDSELYFDSVKTLQNFVPVSRGAVRRRFGFRYLGRVALTDTTTKVLPRLVRIEITTPSVSVTSA